MIKLNSKNGITLIALSVTILIISVLTGIVVFFSIDSVQESIDSIDKSELYVVQHAIQEMYIYTEQAAKEEYIGKKCDKDGNEDVNGEYYLLKGEEDFEKLGITGQSINNSEFVVKYETGYVKKINSSIPALQGYNNDTSGNVTSEQIGI